jgi:tetratricopeptide (TPR) repeat protein
VDQLARDAQEHGLVVLAGAAVSMPPPSSLPGWTQLNTGFLEALGVLVATRTEGEVDASYVGFLLHRRDETGHIPPDFQAQLAEDECDLDYFRVLRSLDIDTWNACHGSLAVLAQSGVLRALVTTNFDRLAERALGAAGVEVRVFCDDADFAQLDRFLERPDAALPVIKVHGTVERVETMVDTLRQRVIGRPEALERALVTLFARHAVLVAGFSGADLAYDPDYLGLRAGAGATTAFVVLNRAGTEPQAAMAELVAGAGPHARFVEGELPHDLEALARLLAPGRNAPRPEWDAEMEFPGVRASKVSYLAYEWAQSVGWLRAGNILASLCEAAGSLDAARRLLTVVSQHALGAFQLEDPGYARHFTLLGRNLVEHGSLAPTGEGGEEQGIVAVGFLKVAGEQGGRVDALAELARALIYLGYTTDALACSRRVSAALDTEPRAATRLDCMLSLASVHGVLGEVAEGLDLCRSAFDLAAEVGDEPRRARACAHLGRFLAADDSHEEAEACLEDGFAVARRLGLAVLEAYVAVAYGRLELWRDRPEEARRYLSAACASFRRSQLHLPLAESLLPLFDAAHVTADMELATAAMNDFEALVPRMPGLLPDYHATCAVARLRSGQMEAAADAVGRLREAAQVMENPWGLRAAETLAKAL